MELERQTDELVEREGVVDGDALGQVGEEAVHGERIVELALHALEHGAQERRLAIDSTEVTRRVVDEAIVQELVVDRAVGHGREVLAIRPGRCAVGIVVVVTTARDGERLESVDQLTARLLDLETGVRIDGRIAEVQIDAAERDRRIDQTVEVHLDDVVDGDAEVRLDRLDQERRTVGVVDVDAVELAVERLVRQQRDLRVARVSTGS